MIVERARDRVELRDDGMSVTLEVQVPGSRAGVRTIGFLRLSRVLPLTYAVEGLRNIMIKGADLSWSSLQLDVGVVLGFCILVILAGATTLRRRIA